MNNDNGARIHITGIVQGVGFRPFVYNLAGRFNLSGWCLNDSEGVIIEVQGRDIPGFIDALKMNAPPLSRIETLTVEPLKGPLPFSGFSIRESVKEEGKSALISPDTALCPDCLRELFDPLDRRNFYPFINCTNCGPRYSIVKDIPYDRPRTTMAPFKLCPDCDKEYHDPSDRRFHAQPNACASCGPRVWLTDREGRTIEDAGANYEAITKTKGLLKDGEIVAVKGLGGFHLACDATNEAAVARLRDNKRKSYLKGGKSNKPFAVMAASIEAIEAFASMSAEEKRLLEDRKRPIVLLEKTHPAALSGLVAPNNRCYGAMLPYTPLHYLLFHESDFKALVMTSGNLSEEPIVISNEEAVKRLFGIADFFLLHDRDIYMRVDDSIARAGAGGRSVIRRARGFTPSPIPIDEEMDEILACGGLLKNTFTITKGRNAIVSQHIGDLENFEALEFFKESLGNLKNTFKAAPSVVAVDMHPDYLSSRFGREYAADNMIPDSRVIPVQHHHAHIVSVMAERGLKDTVIGVAFDGTGYGTDGNIWGGEFLISDRRSFRRAAHMDYLPLPGGDRAIKEPWRTALSYLSHTYGEDLSEAGFFTDRLDEKETRLVLKMIKSRVNSPLTSSAGRLFDAVASLIGLKDRVTFEAEAAIELESIAQVNESQKAYGFDIIEGEPLRIDLKTVIRGIVSDVKAGVDKSAISGRFHITVAEAVLEIVNMISGSTGIKDAALSGGVFQNCVLTRLCMERLTSAGFKTWTNEEVPANDGGVSLGQAVIAWETVKGER